MLVASSPVFSQTAPQRSEELCVAIQPTALENARRFEFDVMRSGACRVNIDNGYDLFVTYDDRALHLAIGVNLGLLNGDASAFWLHLSAFDNLVHSALGTKPQAVFDNLAKLAKALAQKASKGGLPPGTFFDGKTDRALLSATGNEATQIIIFGAYADVRDIDKMKRSGGTKASDGVPTWRRILALSLQVFGAGAQGYANAYRGAQYFTVAVTTAVQRTQNLLHKFHREYCVHELLLTGEDLCSRLRFAHRALAAFSAICDRLRDPDFAALATPPFRPPSQPRATA
jgi:hypothetical protein